jgi:hypothetical protein
VHHLLSRAAGALALTLGLAACGLLDERPDAAARRFWDAVRAGDWERARAASTATDTRRLESLFGSSGPWTVTFGEVLAGEDTALVETRLVRGPEVGTPAEKQPAEKQPAERGPAEKGSAEKERAPLEFHTRLVRVGGEWRVDPEATAHELRTAALDAAFDEVQEGLREGGRALGEALERGATEASEALRRAIDELEREPTAPPR